MKNKEYLTFSCIIFLIMIAGAMQINNFNDFGTSERIIFNSNDNITRNITMNKDSNISHATLSLANSSGYIENFSTQSNPTGITNIGNLIYITDQASTDKVYKYWMNGTYTGENFSTSGETSSPRGITNNGTYFYIVGGSDNKVYKYWINGTYTGTSFSTSGQTFSIFGITELNNILYVTGAFDNKVYKYWINGTYTGTSFSTQSNPTGITNNGTYFYIITGGVTSHIYKYWINGTYTGENFGVYNTINPTGITSIDEYLYITDYAEAIALKYFKKSDIDNPYIKLNNTNIWNYTGEFTSSETTSDFSTILNTALNGGACDCTGCQLDGNDCTINFTFHSDTAGVLEYSNINITWSESINPNLTINTPTGEYSTTQIPYNLTTSDNDQLETCKYWVTRGASLEVANTTLTCSGQITGNTYVSSQNTAYVFHAWVQDRSGNINYTTSNFATSQNATIISPPSGGGGGGTVIVGEAEDEWTMQVGKNTDKYEVAVQKGIPRTLQIEFENLIEDSITINLECEDIEGNICQYVTFEEDQFELKALKDTIQSIDFIIDLPESSTKEYYEFNIKAKDQKSVEDSITIILNVSLLGLITNLFTKILSFPYILYSTGIFLFIFWILTKIIPKKAGMRGLVILLGSSIITMLIMYFI